MSDASSPDAGAWLAAIGRPAARLTPLAGDVSRRAYLRAHHADGGVSIVATYPPGMREVCRRFARTSALLEKAGARVPRIEAADCERGLMLLEDAGEKTLYDRRRDGWPALTPWVERAAEAAALFGLVPRDEVAALNPPLDEPLLRRELAQTWDLLLRPHDLTGGAVERRRLRAALNELCARLGAETPVVCHRDFMARNLVPLESARLVILDHQDLRLGPSAYDLASLLNDSLFAPGDVERRVLDTHLSAATSGSYRRCVVQRALKACGTFAAFAQRGSSRHLHLVPPTLRRAADNLERLPEGAGLAKVIARWRRARPG